MTIFLHNTYLCMGSHIYVYTYLTQKHMICPKIKLNHETLTFHEHFHLEVVRLERY